MDSVVSTLLKASNSSSTRKPTDLDNEHSYDGHNLLHLRMRHQLNNEVNVGIRVTNLTDEYYAERADYSGFAGDRYFIGLPRSLYGDVQIRF